MDNKKTPAPFITKYMLRNRQRYSDISTYGRAIFGRTGLQTLQMPHRMRTACSRTAVICDMHSATAARITESRGGGASTTATHTHTHTHNDSIKQSNTQKQIRYQTNQKAMGVVSGSCA
jgi:hypothetical protein